MTKESSWALIEQAAAGDLKARSEFASKYLPIVRSYLLARWRGKPILHEIEDAVQDVFVDCLRENGALVRAEDRGEGFRGFLYGVTRNIAQRKEAEYLGQHGRQKGADTLLGTFACNETSLTALFAREWAMTIMRDAMTAQAAHARAKGADAERRVELLQLHFHDDLPIREIAVRWQVDPAWLHHQHEQAKKEFQRAWCEVMGLQQASEPQVAAKWREFLQNFARHGDERERLHAAGGRSGGAESSQGSDVSGAR